MTTIFDTVSVSARRAAASWAGAAALAVVMTVTAVVPAHGQVEDPTQAQVLPETVIFTVDVAEDFAKFVPTLVKPTDPEPARGSFFITEGKIFPAGTIQGDGSGFNPNSAGAIGDWFCRGTHLVSATEFPTAARAVDTAQLYLFPDDSRSLSTEGVEGVGKVRRPVTGGTGPLAGYVGEQVQEMLGFNATGGVNLRVTFILRKAVR